MRENAAQEVDQLVDGFLEHHFRFRPVDATFMGIKGHDDRLPPSDPEAPQREAEELAALQKRFASLEQPKAVGAYLDYTILSSQLKHRVRELRERSQYKDPSWYSSETAFAIISLLLHPLTTRRAMRFMRGWERSRLTSTAAAPTWRAPPLTRIGSSARARNVAP